MPVFLCQIIGSGTEGDTFRPAIHDHTQTWQAFDCRMDDTAPAGWMLVTARPTAAQDVAIDADARITPLTRVATQTTAERAALRTKLQQAFPGLTIRNTTVATMIDEAMAAHTARRRA